jgi:hypothetical protein
MSGFEQATTPMQQSAQDANVDGAATRGWAKAAGNYSTETWAAADIERMQQVLFTISDIPGAREWMGTILHDAALELGAKR